MNAQTRWLLIVGAGVFIGLLILAALTLLFWNFSFPRWTHPMIERRIGPGTRGYESNGERIYFSATSASGDPILAEMPGMHRMPGGMLACADCHGPDGRGGDVTMMMDTFTAPDIRFSTLTDADHAESEGAGHEDHPAYTEETIKRAITQGIDLAGDPLDWPMPRWNLSAGDLDDLVEFLMTLK